MIAALTTALAEQPAGIVSISYADGRSMNYDRKQAIAELSYWQQQARAQAGSGLQMQRLSLRGDF